MNKYKLLIIICFFLITLCLPRVTATVKNLNLLGKVIILDAGHGGKDEGASSGPIKESKLNLILTKKLEKEFSNNQNLKEARKKFIDFTKNLWIQEVTENEVGSNINFKLNKVFELDRLYYEIKTKYDILYKNLNIEKYTKSTIVIAGVLVALLIFNILNYINMIK